MAATAHLPQFYSNMDDKLTRRFRFWGIVHNDLKFPRYNFNRNYIFKNYVVRSSLNNTKRKLLSTFIVKHKFKNANSVPTKTVIILFCTLSWV